MPFRFPLASRARQADGLATARYTSFLHDPVEQRLYGTTVVEEFLPTDQGGGSLRHQFVEHLRYSHVVELRLRLALAGFDPSAITFHGSHDRGELTPRSLKMIILARRAER